MDIKRIYAATVGSDLSRVISEYKTGIEIDNFCQSVLLEDVKEIEQAGKLMKLSDRHIIHGPFTELFPAAIDPKARSLAFYRLNQAYDVCMQLGVWKLVVHSGYVPFVFFKGWHIERSVEFWQEFMRDKSSDFHIYIENVLEDEPYMMYELVERISDDRVHICIDTGHVNAASSIEIEEWFKVLGELTGHIHIHNNNGKADEHNSLDKGSLNMDKVMEYINTYCKDDTTITVEAYDLYGSFRWLEERGYI